MSRTLAPLLPSLSQPDSLNVKAQKKRGAELVRRISGFLFDPLAKLSRNPRALLAAPTSVLERFQADLLQAFKERPPAEDDIRQLMGLFAEEDISIWESRFRKLVSSRRTRVAKTEAGSEILASMDAAHKRVRNSPLTLSPSLDAHRSRVEGLIVARQSLLELRKHRGESRARKLWIATAHVAEGLHRPFVEGLWTLESYAKNGRIGNLPGGGKYGALINELFRMDEERMRRIIPADAANLRNAIDHAHVRYDPASRMIEFTNKAWMRRLSRVELEELTESMIEVSAVTFPAAIQCFVLDTLVNLFMPVFADLVVGIAEKDLPRLERVGAHLETSHREMFSEIARSRDPGPAGPQS